MPFLSINQYPELIISILKAGSQLEVKTLVNTAISRQEKYSNSNKKIADFFGQNIGQLEAVNAMTVDATQWSNINMARIQFLKIKREYELTSCKI